MTHSAGTKTTALGLRREGWSIDAVAAHLGLSRSTVLEWSTKAGIPSQAKTVTDEQRSRAVQLYVEEGMSLRQAGDSVGVSYFTVSRAVRAAGHEVRSGSAAAAE